MADKQTIQEKRDQVQKTAAVTRGQLEHFFKNPCQPGLISLQMCLFSYVDHYGELLEASEVAEDMKFSN